MDSKTNLDNLLPLPTYDDDLIRRSDLPRYIPVKKQTLARWATEGSGPPFVKIGKRIVAYRCGDVRLWLQQNVRNNTVK
jgi:predicted DNA-binding transcriptional regulator AlpA